jgi:hypothetical protein
MQTRRCATSEPVTRSVRQIFFSLTGVLSVFASSAAKAALDKPIASPVASNNLTFIQPS